VVPAASTTVSAAETTDKTATVTVNTKDTWIINANGEQLKSTTTGQPNPMFQPGDKVQISTTPIAATAQTDVNKFGKTFTWWKNGETHNIYKITSGQYAGYYILGMNVNLPATKPADKPSTSINTGFSSIFDGDANMSVTINAVAARFNGDGTLARPSALNGSISATVDGKQVTAMLHGDDVNTTIYGSDNKPVSSAAALRSGVQYKALFNQVTLNLGNDYANKGVTLTLPNHSWFGKVNGDYAANTKDNGRTKTFTADANGVVTLDPIVSEFYAYDAINVQGLHFYSVKTGEQVSNGSVSLHAVNGKLNVESVYAAATREYAASQLDAGKIYPATTINDIKDQLEKQNIKVDANGYFTAPASFNFNLDAKSNLNGATVSLPVTVTVDNVTPAASQETTRTVKIMHIATIYDKNGKATHEPALRAYNTVSVVSEPVSLKDEKGNDAGKFYKLAGKDQYIKVGNVDGTSRSLKHNSYVYKSTGKRRGKTVLKKGSSVTTYGKSFMIAGHQMYRIGENQYVKKANF
ncbi:SLAP domain-containing protein, partial [Lactobacillus amylovorus]|uniref:SLAP domain-containing protein n=1 Tax=Lactobacillus amylovorus TaxID=1604 RepID=UPI00232F2224